MPDPEPLPESDLSFFASGFRALVIGASGGIWRAMVQTLQAARDILQTLNALQPVDSGCFVAYDGQPLPW